MRVGWLLDGTGRPARKGVRLTVVGGVVQDLRPAAEAAPVEDLPVLDASEDTVIPGLVDAHVHLFMSSAADPAVRQAQLNASYSQLRPVMRGHLAQHLAAGVVAVRDGGDYGGFALRLRREMGASPGPVQVRAAGRAWRREGRYGSLIGRPVACGQDLARAVALEEAPGDHVKIVNSGLNSLTDFGRQTPTQFGVDELRAAVAEGLRRGRRTMVHANGSEAVRVAAEAGVHSVEHGFFMGTDNLARLADRQVVWVPTAVAMQGYLRHAGPDSREADVCRRNLEHQLEQLRVARQKGVRVALGTDAGTLGVGHGAALREEIALVMEAGYSLAEALECASLQGARLMGLGGQGVLRPGWAATLVVLPGPPTALPGSLAAPRAVLVDGLPVGPAADGGPGEGRSMP
jgi:imidazolonepropionase-like amidohydrolase